MNLIELRSQHGKLAADMRALLDAGRGADGDLDADQAQQFDRMKGEVEGLEKRIRRQQDLDEIDRRAAGHTIKGTGDDRLDVQIRSFSLLRAIASQVPDLNVDSGREREVSQELQRRSGRAHQGITVPLAALGPVEQRTQQANVGSAGGFLVPGTHRGDLFIDVLRPKLVTAQLGATVLNDLTGGEVSIPRRVTGVVSQWIGENQDIDLDDPEYGQITLTPRTVGARTELTRTLLLQSSPSAEQLARDDFAKDIAEGIDRAAIYGNGIGAVPLGLLNRSIGSFSLSTVNYSNLLEALEDVETANAEGTGWATNPHVVKVLRSTVKVSGDTTGNFIMNEPNSLAGYPLVSSTTIPKTRGVSNNKSALIFGNWSDLIIGYWGTIDILVNPFAESSYAKGNVQVRALLTADVNVRHLESFTAAQDIA